MRYGNDDKDFLDPEHLVAEFEVPFEFPHVESVLVWGDPAVGGVTINQVNTAFETPKSGLKSIITRVASAKCACGKTNCSGHGRCYGPADQASSCSCFAGYSGPRCATNVQDVPRRVRNEGAAQEASRTGTTVCPDSISLCAAGQTCAQFSVGRWGCCPLPNATICDNHHCCPQNRACDKTTGVCYMPGSS